MRRTFLRQLLTGGIALQAANSQTELDPIAGDWHLIAAGDDEVRVPQHRVDLRFKAVAGGHTQGAVVSRRDGGETPLANSTFDGSFLRFQMAAPSGKPQSDMPVMVMTKRGSGFEGFWINGAGDKLGPPLKLVRTAR